MQSFWLLTLILSFLVGFGRSLLVEHYERGYALAFAKSYEYPCFAVVYDEIGQNAYPKHFDFNLTMLARKRHINYAFHDYDGTKTGKLDVEGPMRAVLSFRARSQSDYLNATAIGVEQRGHRSSLIMEFCGVNGTSAGVAVAAIEAGVLSNLHLPSHESPFRVVALNKFRVPFPRTDIQPTLLVLPDLGMKEYGLSYESAYKEEMEPYNSWYLFVLKWYHNGSPVAPVVLTAYEDPNFRLVGPALGFSIGSDGSGTITTWSSEEFGYHASSNQWVMMNPDGGVNNYKGASVGEGHYPVSSGSPVIVYQMRYSNKYGKIFHRELKELLAQIKTLQQDQSCLLGLTF